jgi:hypothetical protein
MYFPQGESRQANKHEKGHAHRTGVLVECDERRACRRGRDDV